MELVETQQAAVVEELLDHEVHRPAFLPVPRKGRVKLAEEIVEMHPVFPVRRHGLVEDVHQPALAPADRSPEVDPARLSTEGVPPPRHLGAQPGEPVDDPHLRSIQLEPGPPSGIPEALRKPTHVHMLTGHEHTVTPFDRRV